MPRIDVYRNGELEIQVKVAAEPLLLGRGEDCGVRINDPAISRKHAEIVASGDGFLFRNLSRFGTRINAEMVEAEHPLATGDRIYIGNQYALIFKDDQSGTEREIADTLR
jgi:pSer/pThr/pTyr-binding forkhead associated (FHA) protein